jgi:hypothetical protein
MRRFEDTESNIGAIWSMGELNVAGEVIGSKVGYGDGAITGERLAHTETSFLDLIGCGK